MLNQRYIDRWIANTIQDERGCLVWQGCTSGGYARAYADLNGKPRTVLVHRELYKALRQEIPASLDAEHLCRNRACINVDHLEPVSRKVNVLRGIGHTAVNAAKTHCIRGHALTPDNLGQDTGRRCLACKRLQWHRTKRGNQ